MDMFNENVVLCASSAYEKKFYLNEAFDKLPEDIKNELKIMCVLFTEEVGGILTRCYLKLKPMKMTCSMMTLPAVC